ncbi:MAG: ankyrin repeat domain-containing protein [Proteobacteria bacterium]|nr:ankyrin repeat domain-containing protein [Pseudomonadota bacterium]
MRFLRFFVTGMVLGVIGLNGLEIREAAAQFSHSWEFLKAVEDDDRKELRQRERKGANVNAKNGDGLPAMIIAAEHGNVGLMKFILELGVNVDGRAEDRRDTALMRRAEIGDMETVRFLVTSGADVNLKDRGGENALMKATRARKRRIVEFLIASGADVKDTDYTGRTALNYAEEARARSIMKLLRKAESSS